MKVIDAKTGNFLEMKLVFSFICPKTKRKLKKIILLINRINNSH